MRAAARLAALATALAPLAHAGVVLTGPEIAKLDWNTRCLQSADINGDGREDLLLINNDRASIEFLLQRAPGEKAEPVVPGLDPSRWEPVLDDARFKRVTLTVGATLYDLVTGDFDGDGKTDLAYTGEPDNLTLRLQRKDSWETKLIPLAPAAAKFPSGLRVADIDGDKRDDIVILGQKELGVLLQKSPGEFTLVDRLPLTDENPFGLEFADVDGDGRTDLLYLTNAPVNPLRVRRQNQDGRFGAEESYDLKGPSSLLQPMTYAGAKRGPASFVTVLGTTGQLQFSHFTKEPADDDRGPALTPLVFAPRINAKNPALPLAGDFDGDGKGELAFADPDGAQLYVYDRDRRGDFTVATAWPTLADVKSAACVQWGRKGAANIVLASAKEGVFAEQSADRDGKFGPPRTLSIPGRPVLVAGGSLRRSGEPVLATVAEQDGKRLLTLWDREKDGALRQVQQIELSGMRADPRDLRLHDLDQDGLTDLMLFVPRDGVRVWLQGEDGKFAEASSRAAYRPGLLAKVEPAAVSSADVDGDGKPELLVVSDNFARALRMRADGEMSIVAQFNAGDSTAELDSAFVLPDGKGRPARVVLRNRKADEFQVLEIGKDGASRVVDTRRTARIESNGQATLVGLGGRTELVLFARDRFWWLPVDRDDLRIAADSSLASDLPKVRYNYVLGDDFDGDGTTDLLAIDTDENLVELLQRDPAGAWSGRLHFKIFETDARTENRRGGQEQEPREAVTADVTGDGKPDLVLLVHDRVLVYPQK